MMGFPSRPRSATSRSRRSRPGTPPLPPISSLVGDATIDPFQYLGTSITNDMPAELHQILTDGEIPTDNGYAAVLGSDPLPDLFVGRIPAASPAEAAAAVAKILQREAMPPPGAWMSTVSHFADKGGNFTFTLDTLAAQHVPPSYTVHPIYADNYPTFPLMKAATIAELDAERRLPPISATGPC